MQETRQRRRVYDEDDERERPRGRRDEERPARRRTSDEDERPAHRRVYDEEPEDDEREERERPGRRIPRHDDEDEQRPRSRREEPARERRALYEEDEERPRSRRRDDEDDEERPARRNTAPSRRGGTGEAASGWAAAKSAVEAGGFARPLALSKEPIVVKFLDDAPFDSYRAHWLEKSGRRKYRCLRRDSNDELELCPLCYDYGDQPSSSPVHFNVVSFEDPDRPVFTYLEAGARLLRQLQSLRDDKRFSGLGDPSLYVAIRVSKAKNGSSEPHVEVIKTRDLLDDWDIDALTEAELEKFASRGYHAPVEPIPTRKALQELVDELMR